MSTEVIVALIGAGAAIIVAIITAYAALRGRDTSTQPKARRPVQVKQLDVKTLKKSTISQINEYVSGQKQFSAWEVTLALRAAHQDEQIDHSEVRDIVHAHMQIIINDGGYKRTTRQKGGTSFSLYVPVR